MLFRTGRYVTARFEVTLPFLNCNTVRKRLTESTVHGLEFEQSVYFQRFLVFLYFVAYISHISKTNGEQID